jgi:formate-dependent phosphoribosylglycinamide formyltransferase (GAR transformylase)
MKEVMTNKKFAEQDVSFQKACEEAGLPNHITVIHSRKGNRTGKGNSSLTRQASKWRRGKGLAYKKRMFIL